MRPQPHSPGRSAGRRGFTLIEILMVVAIIGILASLLLVAARSAIVRADNAKINHDMLQLQAGLEAFKAKYGIHPPSRIRLRENTPYNLNEGLDAYSYRMLKRLWPNILLNTVQGAEGVSGTTAYAAATDPYILWCKDSAAKTLLNTTWTGTYELEGDECLVFFLGGIAEFDRANLANGVQLWGFSKRATNPGGTPNTGDPATLQREGPYVDFDLSRMLVRTGADQALLPPTGAVLPTTGAHGFPGHSTTYLFQAGNEGTVGKLPSYLSFGPKSREDQRPWAYFCGDGNGAYRPDDINYPTTGLWAEALNLLNPGSGNYAGSGVVFQRKDLPLVAGARPTVAGSSAPNPYAERDSNPLPATGKEVKYAKAESYQLISAGLDGKYGQGGAVIANPDGAVAVPVIDAGPPQMFLHDHLRAGGASYDNASNVAGSDLLGDWNQSQVKK